MRVQQPELYSPPRLNADSFVDWLCNPNSMKGWEELSDKDQIKLDEQYANEANDDMMYEYENHDCHLSPEDGCQACTDRFYK